MKKEDFKPGIWYNSNYQDYYFKFSHLDGDKIWYSARLEVGFFNGEPDWMQNPDYYRDATEMTEKDIREILPKHEWSKEPIINNSYIIY
jgi:hypothetical protein